VEKSDKIGWWTGPHNDNPFLLCYQYQVNLKNLDTYREVNQIEDPELLRMR
jgi:hypothetical protein